MKVVPVVLEGAHVRLEPLALDHVADLARVGLDPELWRFTTQAISTIEDMRHSLPSSVLPLCALVGPSARGWRRACSPTVR